ncbi:MAG: glycogen/starch synthase [Candidatus Aenigmarchaeota archaeon]|nr:glycogen/starch synthase [Candidatus Aenigmarchaeota archaeon]
MDAKADIFYEVSWEVCNKVGGIFTVVASKAVQMMNHYNNYWLIGPYFPKKAFGMFEETLAPEECKTCFDKLKAEGIEVHCGKWMVKGSPNVMLVDFTNFSVQKNSIKQKLWEHYKIDSLYTEWFDFDEPVVFATAAGKVIEVLSEIYLGKKTVAQFHEWLAAAGLLYIKSEKAKVGTVFTTHATTLGRSIAATDRNLYEMLDKISPDENAKGRGSSVFAKHLLEKAAAKNADVFTTVSEITGIEAEKILDRKPDVLLMNGLDMDKFPTFEEASVKHKLFKARIKQFLTYYFFPYQTFDIENTLIYFLAGRYEFTDKGVDVCIKALGKLNEKLKEEKSKKTIVCFFWIPGNIRSIKQELLENKTYFFDLKDSIDDETDLLKTRMLSLLITKGDITKENLFGAEFMQEIKPKVLRLSRKGMPPVATHDLFSEQNDAILNAFQQANLSNKTEDRVKVVFYPIYLTGADGLLDTSYYESMQGAHLGIFPSYYEPWGYTPLEAAALGVSSVTTDLTGFGRYLCTECVPEKNPGIFVLKRFGRAYDETVQDLASIMYYFANLPVQERVANKMTSQKVAATADWKLFIERYIEAHNLAISRL